MIGKTVTLHKGLIVTVVSVAGPSSYNCITDEGHKVEVIKRVIDNLPTTHRRAEFDLNNLAPEGPSAYGW